MHTVTNIQARLMTFAGAKDPKTKKREVIKILPFQTVEVDEETFARWMSSPIGRAGGIKEGRHQGPPTPAPNIGKASEENAIAFVQKCDNLTHLAEWARSETRTGVLHAVRQRQAALTPPPK